MLPVLIKPRGSMKAIFSALPTLYSLRASAMELVLDFVKPPRPLGPAPADPSAAAAPLGVVDDGFAVLLEVADVGLAKRPVHSLGPVWTGSAALAGSSEAGGLSPSGSVVDEVVVTSDCVAWSKGRDASVGVFSVGVVSVGVVALVGLTTTFGRAGMIGTAGMAVREAGLDEGLVCVGVAAVDDCSGCTEPGVVGEVDAPFSDGWSWVDGVRVSDRGGGSGVVAETVLGVDAEGVSSTAAAPVPLVVACWATSKEASGKLGGSSRTSASAGIRLQRRDLSVGRVMATTM